MSCVGCMGCANLDTTVGSVFEHCAIHGMLLYNHSDCEDFEKNSERYPDYDLAHYKF